MQRRERAEGRTFAIALALASGAHVPVLAWRARAPEPVLPPAAAEIELGVDEVPPSLPDEPPPGSPAAASPPDDRAPAAAASTAAPRLAMVVPRPTGSASRAVEPPPVATVAPSASPWSAPFLAGPTPKDVGLSGGNAFYKYVLKDAGAPAVAAAAPELDANRRTRDALREPLREADRSRGLGAGGPVLTALEDATRAGVVPPDSRATFDVRIDGAGRVVSIGLVGASSDHQVFERIAKDALAALAPKRAKVVPGSNGAMLRVEVTSRMQMPSGSKPGGVQFGLGGGSFDVGDIGAKARVVVAARVTSERVID
jgi:hypothetical protein